MLFCFILSPNIILPLYFIFIAGTRIPNIRKDRIICRKEKMSLSGTHLRVAAGLWVPFVTFQDHQDGSFTTSGLLMDFMEIFARKLNFT